MFSAESSDEITVRYSPRIARWIAEREDGEYEPDGSFVVRHPLADLNWGVRHVLQYGADAEALNPPPLRRAIVDALDRMEAAVPCGRGGSTVPDRATNGPVRR